MEPDELDYLKVLKLKIAKLISDNEELQARLVHTEKQLVTLKIELTEQKNKAQVIAEQNKIAKLADAVVNDQDDLQELKKKVNAYIRDIDDCIRLLSER